MKRLICMLLSLALLFSLSVPALAGVEQELTQAEKEALYAKYEALVAAANEKHGLKISVPPFDEIEIFYSEVEFLQLLTEFCESGSMPWVRVKDSEVPGGDTKGAGVKYVPATGTNRHGKATVTTSFYGIFEIEAGPEGDFYVKTQDFYALALSDSSYLYYVKNGYPYISGYADGGRTMIVSATFDVYADNVFSGTAVAHTYYYFNRHTGTITAL